MPAFIVVVASFVTIVQMLLQGFIPTLYSALGIYIPLIVVNCIILGRAEAYASKNPPIPSLFDGIEIIEENFMPPHCQRKRKKPFSHSEYVLLEKEWKRLQQKLFTLAYIPIKADIEALPLKNTSDPIS